MMRKLGPLALLLLLVAVFAVGCGDDDKSDSSNDAPAVTTAAEDTATDDAPAEDAGEIDTSDEALEAGREACKDAVDSNPQVKADLKDDIKAICDSIESGDPEEMKRVARETCEAVVESSVPEGAARDQALESCAAAGG